MSTPFGGLLRAHRERAGLTQRSLAVRTAVSERAIRDLERGRACRPRLVTVRLLADGLGLRDGSRATFLAAAREVGSLPPLRLGGLLRASREGAGLTQRCLAVRTAVSERAIRDLERGRACRPRLVTVRLLADGLGLRGGARAVFLSAARARPVGA